MRRLGKYRLLEPLASGGMAEVWRAEVGGPGGFAKEVAIKLVRADLAADPELVRLFFQEARLASRLGHANLVQVFEFDLAEGRPYLAMELVRGRNLRQVVDRCRETGVRLGLARAVQVAAEVARALAYAHRAADGGVPLGLVHRDVSPANVLVSFEGEVKLADFGIARALGAAEATAPGTVKGKVAYMAPEQARGEPVDGRADLFALGVVLWELVAGRRLFARESDAAALAALLSPEPVSRPSEWNEEVPAALDAAILSALERDRERRTRSADDLLVALAEVRLQLEHRPEDADLRWLMQRLWPGGAVPGTASEPTRPRLPATRLPLPGGEEAATRTLREDRRRVPRWAAPGAALAAGLALAGAWAWAWWERAAMGAGAELRRAASSTPRPTGLPPTPVPATATVLGARGAAPAAAEKGAGATTTGDALPRPLPPGGASAPPATPTRPPAPLVTGTIGSLPLPRPDTGEGILAVNATPWATVHIDGVRAGDTPREWRLPAGRHRLRAAHPGRIAAEADVEVRSGERRSWQPRLSR